MKAKNIIPLLNLDDIEDDCYFYDIPIDEVWEYRDDKIENITVCTNITFSNINLPLAITIIKIIIEMAFTGDSGDNMREFDPDDEIEIKRYKLISSSEQKEDIDISQYLLIEYMHELDNMSQFIDFEDDDES
jgi:hypothetical protein